MAQILDDTDADALIARLARPLAAADRQAFDTAARAALAHVSCLGAGSVYRAVASLQRAFRDPPSDRNAHWDIDQEFGPSKLRDAPAIEYGGDLRHVRYRKHYAR